METGSIARWTLKEGDRFEAGTAICEVETDKTTVTYEATEEGYLAKILVGTGEVKVRLIRREFLSIESIYMALYISNQHTRSPSLLDIVDNYFNISHTY